MRWGEARVAAEQTTVQEAQDHITLRALLFTSEPGQQSYYAEYWDKLKTDARAAKHVEHVFAPILDRPADRIIKHNKDQVAGESTVQRRVAIVCLEQLGQEPGTRRCPLDKENPQRLARRAKKRLFAFMRMR